MKHNILYYSTAVILLFSSCANFLEEYSQNAATVSTINDLEELLVGECYMKTTTFGSAPMLYVHLMSDECIEKDVYSDLYLREITGAIFYQKAGMHRWYENPFEDAGGKDSGDKDWAAFYHRISVLNSIIYAGLDFKPIDSKEEGQLNMVLGEAYFLRAWNYFMLANIYGAPYNKNNRDDHANVTWKSDPAIEEIKFSRNSTGMVYDNIVKDLEQAVNYLEVSAKSSKFRVGPAACYALLSRVYLYMEEYELAIKAANKVEGYPLYNLVRDYAPGSGKSFLTAKNPEVIFTQGTNFGVFDFFKGTGARKTPIGGTTTQTVLECDSYVVSPDIQSLFDDNDIRFSAFFTLSYQQELLIGRKYRNTLPHTSITEKDPITKNTVSIVSDVAFNEVVSMRYAEVVLNKAEAQACLGDAGAATTMKEFLTTRYKVPPIVPTEKNALIEFVRKERQKELCYEGHRWFDLRRYAVNTVLPVAKSITHEYYEKVNGVTKILGSYTLQPYSDVTKGSWIVPVPPNVIDYCYPNLTNFDRSKGVVKIVY